MQVPATERQPVRFGPFTVDLVSHELLRDGHKISLQEKPFQVLTILLEQPGKLVTREELRNQLWPADTFVDFEHSINTAIKKVREAVEDSGEHPKFIETLPRRGYRFIGTIEVPRVERRAAPHNPAELRKVPVEPTPTIGKRYSPAVMLMAGTAVVVVLTVAAATFWHRGGQGQIPAVNVASIAVLPFADLSSSRDQGYFSEGLAEEILNHLTKIPNLKVTARASAFQFKDKSEDSRVVGQKLDVANILEGSVQREQSRVRVTARLVKADDGFDLWSESFDRDLKDIFAVEDDIAKAVTSALQLKLLESRSPANLKSSGTTNPDAYEAFLHARYFAHMQDPASAKKALQYADKAIQSDPNYAPAYALRANIELAAGGMTWIDLADATERTRHDTEKAIALDPNLADGYRVLSMIQSWSELNCPEAQASLNRAIDLAPGDPDNLGQGALLSMCLGQSEQAVQLWKQELLLDPLRPEEYLWLAQALRDLGRYEEAHAALAKALDLNPNNIEMIHEVGGEVCLAQGHAQEALVEFGKEPAGLYRDLGMALGYHALGGRMASDTALSRMLAQHSNDGAYQIAQVYAYRGEVDRAFQWLDRAYAQHDPGLVWFKTDLKMKSLQDDPRYAQLLKQLHLPE
jgi:TolB-like protein/DNA-binding winged helix-turn-helix (wHTH) protein/Tfp pilus assembly protein PilF